jgi:HEXXH motif-containing protein
MRERLAESLEYLFGQVGEELAAPPGARDKLTAQIRSRPQSPQLFGTYFDLVLALEADDVTHARKLAHEILAKGDLSGTQIGAIDDRPASEAERYRRLLLADVEVADAPDAALMAECRERIGRAFKLLDTGFPEMAEEIRALLRDIVVAAGPTDPKALTFDGASSYMLWGAIMLNARGQKTVLDTAQALAHESGHNLLFGFCASGPLIENPDEELFSSPLRSDPRPMDGVVHATYVVARMHQTLSRLLESGAVDQGDIAAAQKDLVAHRRNFQSGDEVIRASARLTEVGRAAMEAARTYMAAAA